MCYDISFTTSIRVLSDHFPGLKVNPQLEVEFAIEHVQAQAHLPHPVILEQEAELQLQAFEWGVIPDYMKTWEEVKKGRALMCNAQSEKITGEARSYWRNIRQNRCLVPVSGIFEHRAVKSFKNRIPYYITLKERDVFFLPGLYTYSHLPDEETGQQVGTFTIITRAANDIMKQIHNGGPNAFRMPVFLPEELEREWLDPALTDKRMQEVLQFEMPSGKLDYWPVYPVRTAAGRTDNQPKTAPFAWRGLPEPGKEEQIQQQSLF